MAHIHPSDTELDFLRECTAEELEPIVGALLGTVGEGEDKQIAEQGRASSALNKTNAFIRHYPDHTKYVDEIITEIQTYGGNAIANTIRGYGVPYREVLIDVAKKLKVNFNSSSKTVQIERCLLDKVLEDAWEQMSEDEKRAVLHEAGETGLPAGGTMAAKTATAAFLLSVCLPVSHLLAGVLATIMLLGPAFRVTIPAVIQIAILRRMKMENAVAPLTGDTK